MKRRGKSLEHLFGIEMLERGMGSLQVLEVFKYGFNHVIDDLVINVFVGDNRGGHRIGLHIIVHVRVCPRRDFGHDVVGILLNHFLDAVMVQGNHSNIDGRCRLFNGRTGIAHGIEKSVYLLIHKGPGCFMLLQALGIDVFFLVNAVNTQHILRIAPLPRTRIADVHSFSLEVAHFLNTGVFAGHQHYGLGMHAEHAAQIFNRFAVPIRLSVVGLIVAVRLGHAKIKSASFNGVDIENGSAGGPSHVIVLLVLVFIHQVADLQRHLVINPGYGGTAEKDVLGGFYRGSACQQPNDNSQCDKNAFP